MPIKNKMNILLMSTAQPQALVALARDNVVVAEKSWTNTPALGRELLQVIDALLKEQTMPWSDIDRIGVHGGPGHYSALRHGVVTAAMLAYAHQMELVPVTGESTSANLLQQALVATPVAVIKPHYTVAGSVKGS